MKGSLFGVVLPHNIPAYGRLFNPDLLRLGLEYSLKAHVCGKGFGAQLGTVGGLGLEG